MSSGAKVKGWIKNNKTKSLYSFQYNPAALDYTRTVMYGEVGGAGSDYPGTQFVRGGAKTVPLELFIFDKPFSGEYNTAMDFLNDLVPGEDSSDNSGFCTTATLCFGSFIIKCVIEELSVHVEETDDKLNPVHATITLSLRKV